MNRFLAIFVLIIGTNLQAQTIFNDGQTHTLTTSNGPIETIDGTTVNFNSGATITGGFALPPQLLGYTTSIYSDTTSITSLNGGQILAPMAPGSPAGNISGIAIYSDGTFTGTSGLAQGGDGANYQMGGSALLAHGNVNVTGGTFMGGAGGLGNYGGVAAYMQNLDKGVVTTVNIGGGTFEGGSASAGGSTALSIATNGIATITGGTFTGGEDSTGWRNDSLDFTGGGQSKMNILGGEFMSPLEATLNSNDTLNFMGMSSFDVEKMQQFEQWQVTGMLLDGTPLDITLVTNAPFYFETPITGGMELTFISIPEPKSWILLLIGFTGCVFCRKMR